MNPKIPLSIQNLSAEQLENILFLAEQVARKYISSQIPSKEIKNLEVLIEFDTTTEFKLECIIDIQLIRHSKINPQKVSDQAVQKVFEFFEKELNLTPS